MSTDSPAAPSAGPVTVAPEWTGRGDARWSTEGPAVPSGLPGMVYVPVAGARQRGLLCAGDDAAAVKRWTELVEEGRGIGLPVPRQLDAVHAGEQHGVVIEQIDHTLSSWWLEQPGAERLGQIAGTLAGFVEGLNAAAEKDAAAIGDLRLYHRSIVHTRRGRLVLGPACLTPLRPAQKTAPEQVFGAEAPPPARASWQLGELLFSLFAAPPGRLKEGRLAPTQRARLIADLHRSRPRLFSHRALDPREFLYPDALPEQDRAAIAGGLRALLVAHPLSAVVLAESCARILDEALAVDPAARARGLPRLAVGLRSLETQLAAIAKGQPQPSAAPDAEPAPPAVEKPAAAPPAPPAPRVRSGLWLVAVAAVGALGLATGVVLGRVTAPESHLAPQAPPTRTTPAALVEDEADPPPAPATPAAASPTNRASRNAAAPPRSTRSSSPAPPTPAPEAREATEVAVDTGRITIEGGSCRVVASDGAEQACGSLPVGRYAIWARPSGGQEIALGSHVLRAGKTIAVKCGFGTCRLR